MRVTTASSVPPRPPAGVVRGQLRLHLLYEVAQQREAALDAKRRRNRPAAAAAVAVAAVAAAGAASAAVDGRCVG